MHAPLHDSAVACLAILDWGIGGIDFYRHLVQQEPNVPVIYFSDAGFEPYGLVSPADLYARLERVVAFLAGEGATHVVVACNAASTTLRCLGADCLDTQLPLPCLGVIGPAIAAIKRHPGESVVVLGGQRTIDSGLYQRALRAASKQVRAIVAQPLSALVECGIVAGAQVQEAVAALLPEGETEILVPACTHYTALLPELERQFKPRSVVSPTVETLRHAKMIWDFSESGDASRRFLTTGDSLSMQQAANLAFATPIDRPEHVALDLSRP